MTATAQVEIGKLSAKAIDGLCLRREELQAELEQIGSYLKEQVELYGYTPARAEKSKRLDGAQFEVTLSSGETTEIRDTAVEAIERACPENVFGKLFRRVTSYKLASGASMVLAGVLPPGSPPNLRKLFAAAVILKPKAPSLRVKRIGEECDAPVANPHR